MALRPIAALVILMLSHTWAGAQQIISGQPIIGSTASEAETAAGATPEIDGGVDILVIGDALGGGLGAGLTRRVELEDGYNVTARFNEESGIARPEVYDWSATLPKILDGKAYDAVVVLLGANDRQTIRSGNFRYGFNTPEWIAAYAAQTGRILDALALAGPKIYWVSIPPMANPDYEAAMQVILQIQKERVEAKGATFVDIRAAFLTADGNYTDQGADDTGELRKLRARDGVTFFKQGNNRMGQLVLAAIKKGQASAPAAKTLTPGATALAKPDLPLFGQTGADGMAVPFRPADPGVAALAGLVASGAVEAGLAALQSLSPPGSAAEKLFVAGEALPPPAGRSDDFSLAK
jgi:uncharacterized protein